MSLASFYFLISFTISLLSLDGFENYRSIVFSISASLAGLIYSAASYFSIIPEHLP
jgi:hypothetical protein